MIAVVPSATSADVVVSARRIDNTFGVLTVAGSPQAGYWGQYHAKGPSGHPYIAVKLLDFLGLRDRCTVAQRQQFHAELDAAARTTSPNGEIAGVRLFGALANGDVIFAIGPSVYRYSCDTPHIKPIRLANGNQYFHLTPVAEMPDGSLWLNIDAHWQFMNKKLLQGLTATDDLEQRVFVLHGSQYRVVDLPDVREPLNKLFQPYDSRWFPGVSAKHGLCALIFRRYVKSTGREILCINSNLEQRYLSQGRVLKGFSMPSGPFFFPDGRFFVLDWTPWGEDVAGVIDIFGDDAWVSPDSVEISKRRTIYLRGIHGEKEGPGMSSRGGHRTILQRGPHVVYVTKKGLYRVSPDGPVLLYAFHKPEEGVLSLLPGPGLSLFITSKRSIYHVELAGP